MNTIMEKYKQYKYNPIFIGGTGRCGTTILAKMLGRHSQIYQFPFEIRFMVDPDGMIDLINALSSNWSPYIGAKAVFRFKEILYNIGKQENFTKKLLRRVKEHIFKKSSYSKYVRLPLGNLVGEKKYFDIVNNFLNKLIDKEFKGFWIGSEKNEKGKILSSRMFDRKELMLLSANFIIELFSVVLKKKNKKYWIDHTPYCILHANILYEMFPNMKMIHIYRDTRDVISSFKTKSWGGNTVEDTILWQKQILEKWIKIKSFLPKETYFEIKMEELVNNPKDNIIKILRFIGVPFDNDILKIDLSKSHSGRWKKDLSNFELRLIKKELLDIMKQYGYSW